MTRSAMIGRQIGRVLEGSWRAEPPIVTASAEQLAPCVTPLLMGGAAALAWRRVKGSAAAGDPRLRPLADAYRAQALHAAIHRQQLSELLGRLRAAGVEPILVKGWDLACRYSWTGARPCGDVDLWVPPSQVALTTRVTWPRDADAPPVDVHGGLLELPDVSYEQARASAEALDAGGVPVLVLDAGLRLRHAALHLMRHGAWRAVWLCDVALLLEQLPSEVPRDRVLGAAERNREYVLAVIALAVGLLGAAPAGQFAADAARPRAPGWLVRAVESHWALGRDGAGHTPFAEALRRRQLGDAIRRRWDPVESTVRRRASLRGWPRAMVQVADGVVRAWASLCSAVAPDPARGAPDAGA